MKTEITQLLAKLESGGLLATPLLDTEEIDTALDARDGEGFEVDWLRVHERLSLEAKSDEPTEAVLKRIREVAFKAAYRHSENPDFAGYVSDDFDLVSRALISEMDDPWLNGLFAEYVAGRFPSGAVNPSSIRLADQI